MTQAQVYMSYPPDMERHIRAVLEGEYDPGVDISRHAGRALDIGANVGAFALWVRHRWPACVVDCYEPNPAAFEFLQANAHNYGGPQFMLMPKAVRAEAGKARLHFGKNNLGEASFHDLGEQRAEGVEVECLPASELPRCDVLKVDTEGCEVEIIEMYLATHEKPKAVLYEFHSEGDRIALAHILELAGYSLTRGTVQRADRGVMCWVRP